MANNLVNFKQTITTEEELRGLLGYPGDLASKKVIDNIDEHCRDFISKSPFLVLSTTDSSGNCDVSPRGDAPGFVHILDEKHLVIPERPGNRRLDSLKNILSNPRVGLLFLIPGLGETLRINGKACLVTDKDLLEKSAVNGRTPLISIAVEAEECFIHCAKALKRSALWQQDTWAPAETLPSAAKMMASHAKSAGLSEEGIADRLEESYTKRLY
ncbi:pyridoxamine 5'-phosphate oxidase family protein [Mesobacillus harenae]|uniref:pyridoxamine 5'-phosphate oxidase family protein n=1 Tax=Mesobacillus harenae TaxID=2213203 RepID=UPI0015809008|nr:pyridoxamine 5'-phosphate oxidase family protein [Mesobacillus harenae]